MGNNRLQLEKLKKLTITNSGENIPKDTSTLPDAFWEKSPPMYETFRVLQLLELDMWVVGSDPLTLGGNTPCAPLESLDIHITSGSNSLVKVHIPRALRRVVKFSSIMRRSKVVTMHFFIPQLVRDAGDMDRDNEHLLKLAKTLRERLHDEAIMGEIALVRSNIGPFRPVVDIGLPDVDVLGSNDNYRTYSLFDTSIE
ncbi:hypothetical protein CPC08DRAFT_145107 [Agrocybe pediades]|nr:hypothetical protein CPC08DRAFT_145107 [Agrocybe pediades]